MSCGNVIMAKTQQSNLSMSMGLENRQDSMVLLNCRIKIIEVNL